MRKVTFEIKYKIGKKLKTQTLVEYTEADDDHIKLHALALNWTLIKIEDIVTGKVLK